MIFWKKIEKIHTIEERLENLRYSLAFYKILYQIKVQLHLLKYKILLFVFIIMIIRQLHMRRYKLYRMFLNLWYKLGVVR